MKCKCSLNNNYEVIGLCDIEEFNQKISKFRDKSWTEISLPEKFKIPSNKPAVKFITKVYLDIKITSTKIIKTPYSNSENIEKLKLTGKSLLVSGEIYQKVMYIANGVQNSIHSIKFKVSFSTYIVIDKNADLNNDNYCIYPCIENISINILNKRTLIKNMNLLLFAHKTTTLIEKLPNYFVFKTFNNNEEMAKIEFDTNTKRLMVTSTGKLYNGGVGEAFNFKLLDSDGRTVKVSSRINKNGDANNFKDTLNNTNFEFGQIILIEYNDKTKVELTNYPNEMHTYNMINVSSQSFKISEEGIIPNLRPNSIILNDANNEPVIITQFDAISRGVLVNSTGNRTGQGGPNYFKMTLYGEEGMTQNQNAQIQRKSESIAGNQDGNAFSESFSREKFKVGDILKLEYEDRTKVKITNFPNKGEDYTPKGNQEEFELNEDDIIPYIPKLPNEIIIKSKDNIKVATIEFNKDEKKFIVSSTEIVPDPSSTEVYFTLILKDNSAMKDKLTVTLNSNQNANNFRNILNDKVFDYNDFLLISYKDKTKIEITNFQEQSNNYIPTSNADILEITNNGLVNKSLNSKIKILNDDGKEISTVLISNINNLIFATSTKDISTNRLESADIYTQLIHYQASATIFTGEIYGKKDASEFVEQLNAKRYISEMPIRLYNKISDRIIITNYRNQLQYQIGQEPEFFKVVGENLVQYNLPYNKIRFKNKDNSSIFFIYFDKVNANAIYIEPYSTRITNTDSDFFSFEILGSNERPKNPPIKGTINKGQSGESIRVSQNISNIEKVQIGDILKLSYPNSNLVEVYSFPDITQTIPLPPGFEKFTITQNGLVPKITKLDNDFVLLNNTDEEIMRMQFDIDRKKLKISSTGKLFKPASIREFRFWLTDSRESVKKSSTIASNENADKFRDDVNGSDFDFGYFLSFRYDNKNKFKLTNYPVSGNDYFMRSYILQSFKITQNGIIPNVIANSVILNDDSSPVVTIQFDRIERFFIVESTGKTTSAGGQDYFKVTVYKEDGITTIGSSKIGGGEDANNFATYFSSIRFDWQSILKLEYEDRTKVKITNFPNEGEEHIPLGREEKYTITKNALVLYVPQILKLPNQISIKSKMDRLVATIEFNKTEKKFIVVSTGTVSDATSSDIYFTLILKSASDVEKSKSTIVSNKDAHDFKVDLNDKSFEYGDKLELIYKDKTKIEITNYPRINEDYIPNSDSNIFEISNNGLISTTANIQNEFILLTQADEEMGRVGFDAKSKKLIVTSTGEVYGTSEITAFIFNLIGSDFQTKKSSTINQNQNANEFKNELNDIDFEFGDIITLFYNNRLKIKLTNYPSQGQQYTMIAIYYQSFKITESGIIPNLLPNDIILNDDNNNPVIIIQLDEYIERFIVDSTGKITSPTGGRNYFKVTSYKADGITEIISQSISGNSNGSTFRSKFSGEKFEFGGILKLAYEEADKVKITNFEGEGKEHTPSGSEEKYKITNKGLEPFK